LLQSNGFDRARFFDELQRPLTDLPGIVAPPGIEIEPWEDSHREPARLVSNSAFADHWGSTLRSADAWETALKAPGRRLDLSFVATEGQEVVGYSLNGFYADDEAVTGRKDGWIESLGTLRSHRGRGIASSLIVASLHAFQAAGLNSSMLGVDTENPSGAYGIYQRLGFEPLNRMILLSRTIREGPE